MIIHAQVAILSVLCSTAFLSAVATYANNNFSDYGYASTVICIVSHIYLSSKVVAFPLFEVAWRAYFLGLVFSSGILTCIYGSSTYLSTGLYLIVLSLFHFGEYLATALFNPSTLQLESFILNHSVEYNVALLASWIEHGIYIYLIPDSFLISSQAMTITGFFLCLF